MENDLLSSPSDALKTLIQDTVQSTFLTCFKQLNNQTEIEKPLDTAEAADIVKIKLPTLYALIHSKAIPSYKRGKRRYFFPSELSNRIKDGRSETNTELLSEAQTTFRNANKRIR